MNSSLRKGADQIIRESFAAIRILMHKGWQLHTGVHNELKICV